MVSGPLPPPPRRDGPPAGWQAPSGPGAAPPSSPSPPPPPSASPPWSPGGGYGPSGRSGPGSPSGWSPQQRPTDGVAIAAIVTGSLGLLASLIPVIGWFIGVPLALAALVCGFIGLRRGIQRGLSIGGLVTGALAILVSIAYGVLLAFVVSSGSTIFQDVVAEAEGEVFGPEGAVLSSSPCEGNGETVEFAVEATGGPVNVSQVHACPDFADDVQFALQVDNTSSEPQTAEVTVTATAGGDIVSDSVVGDVFLEAGQGGWVEIVTFDDWQPPDQVDVTVESF